MDLKAMERPPRVALLKCDTYHPTSLKTCLQEGLQGAGLSSSIFKGKKVLLTPNLLRGSPPERAVCTHPDFFRAMLRLVKECGGDPVLAESPAFQALSRVLKETGYDRVLREEGCRVADTADRKVLFNRGGRGYRRFELPRALFDADIIVNLPKFKTHSLTTFTGAVKNLFGLIHGLNKSQWHVKAPSREAFSNFLLDLYEALLTGFESPKPILHVMDGILAMEGEGPGTGGTPRMLGAVIVGRDALAVDALAVDIAGLDPDRVATLRLGGARGLGETSPHGIDVACRNVKEFGRTPFVPPKSTNRYDLGKWPTNTSFFKNLFVERPVPADDRCTRCYRCKTICPGGAVEEPTGEGRVPHFDYGKCIRCYCCMEICPEAAITLKPGRLQWILDRRG